MRVPSGSNRVLGKRQCQALTPPAPLPSAPAALRRGGCLVLGRGAGPGPGLCPPPRGALVHAREREQSLEGRPGGRLLHGSLRDGAALLEDLVG